MRVRTGTVSPGDWIVVEDGAPNDMRIVKIGLNGESRPAFIEGSAAMVRCPTGLPRDSVLQVTLDGDPVGRVIVR